jgi:hypothetical protein
LVEIVKNNTAIRKELASQIEEIVQDEKNDGVKNVYLKALRIMNY